MIPLPTRPAGVWRSSQTEKLAQTASGLRHLRWVKRIVAKLRVHQKHNYLLASDQQNALMAELAILTPLVTALADAVAPYRAFVEEAYLDVHAAQTVTDYLCDEGQRTAQGRLSPWRAELEKFFKAAGGFAAISPGGHSPACSAPGARRPRRWRARQVASRVRRA